MERGRRNSALNHETLVFCHAGKSNAKVVTDHEHDVIRLRLDSKGLE